MKTKSMFRRGLKGMWSLCVVNSLIQVQKAVVESKFMTAVSDTLDIFYGSEGTPCSECIKRSHLCTKDQLKFCNDLKAILQPDLEPVVWW